MSRQTLNRLSAFLPVLMSLLALIDVGIAVTTGWERGLEDEGAAAHIFQLLVVAQAPLILLFLATADWRRIVRVVAWLAAQSLALALAFAPVAALHL
jgi:hypothetical protein